MNNFYAKLARAFVLNHQLSWLLILTTFALGAFAFVAMPKQYNPQIALPAFRITTEFTGATANEVENLVTNELENKIAEIPGVDEISSQSRTGGVSLVSVLFKIGEDEEIAKTKINEKLSSNFNLAPLGVRQPLVQQINPENVPIFTIAITSQTYSSEGLRAFAFDLREKLKTIEGATNFEIKGGRARSLNVTLDPAQLAARGVDVGEVIAAIQKNNFRTTAGTLENSENYITTELDGNLTTVAELGRLALRADDNPVFLEDVATITDDFATRENFVRFDQQDKSQEAIFLSFAKLKGANAITITDAAKAQLEEFKTGLIPAGIDLQIVRDEGRTASEAIGGLVQNLLSSIAIVAFLLIFFLRWRAALVVALAIPLTFALVLFVGMLFGQTINRITLFALILSLGLLVDSATVVVENIYRHLGKNTEPRSIAIGNAVGEVGAGLLLSTLTSVIVFVPLSFVTGMMGAYMGPIAFFVPAALLASQAVAYVFSPFLAAQLLKENEAKAEQKTTKLDLWYRHAIEKLLDSRKLQNRVIAGVIAALIFTFSFPVFEIIHFRMLPKADREQFFIYLDAPENTPLPTTNAFATQLENFLLADPAIISIQSFVGTSPVVDFNGLFKGADARVANFQATFKINLTPPGERAESSEAIVARLRPEVQKLFAAEPDLKIQLVEDPPGPPVAATLLTRVIGPDTEIRENIARDLIGFFRQTPGVVDFDSSLPSGASEKLITVDHAKLAHSGLSVEQVLTAVGTALDGRAVALAHLDTREQNSIFVRFTPEARDEVADLNNIFLKNSRGEMVALGSVTNFSDATTPPILSHFDREPVTFVSGELQNRAVVYAIRDLILNLRDYRLPDGHGELVNWNLFGFEFRDDTSHEIYRVEWGGEFEMTLENFRDLGLAMLVAFALVYALLVAQFRSFRTPLLVMSSIILAFGGVLFGFAILDFFGIYFTATSMIGIIALGGIVVNNAIILLEFLEQAKARGLPPRAAIIEAAQTRLRPILLTSLTTVLGSLTIVGDPVWSGLAWSIIFGLSLSTVLTLVVFPMLYFRFESGEN